MSLASSPCPAGRASATCQKGRITAAQLATSQGTITPAAYATAHIDASSAPSATSFAGGRPPANENMRALPSAASASGAATSSR
eukprot:COSAG06_NODE_155_length_21876_cov_22.287643_6_plen_84_part_00